MMLWQNNSRTTRTTAMTTTALLFCEKSFCITFSLVAYSHEHGLLILYIFHRVFLIERDRERLLTHAIDKEQSRLANAPKSGFVLF